MRGLFRVRYEEFSGRDGGSSGTKTFKTTATDPTKAGRKLHKKGKNGAHRRVVSVRLIKWL